MHRLCDGPRPNWPAKATWLAQAINAGLPVPRGCVHAIAWSDALEAEVRTMLREGPLIVRSALHGEDGAQRSAAGLGQSFSMLDTMEAVRDAIRRADEARADPWLIRYRGHREHPHDAVIVQRQAPRDLLVVAALLPSNVDYIEVHEVAGDVLDVGATPVFSGLRSRWPQPMSTSLGEVLDIVREHFSTPIHGLDVECVIGSHGVQVVQVRALSRDLTTSGRAFIEAVHDADQGDRIRGRLQLDAEHNPAPLSPAHASLMTWLAQARPASGGLTTLAGWLYVRTKVRDLGVRGVREREVGQQGTRASVHGDALRPRAALDRLTRIELPAARTRLQAIDAQLAAVEHESTGHGHKGHAPTPAEATLSLLKRDALAAFLAMIDVYLGVLVPARGAAGKVTASTPTNPLSLRGRAEFADVLPTVWDIAAPTFVELDSFTRTQPNTNAMLLNSDDEAAVLPSSDDEAAVLLTEWDDHLFALGLAPLRRVYLAYGRYLQLGPDVFGLTLQQLDLALKGALPDAKACARDQLDQTARWAQLDPPLCIDEGVPLPVHPQRHLHGIAFGEAYEGVIAQRDTLEALLEDPPASDAIVVLPSLTAQAALAISTLGLQAVCCEHGGAMSHAALIMRELGLSGLVGCVGCTTIESGTTVRIDVTRGRLQIASSVTLGS